MAPSRPWPALSRPVSRRAPWHRPRRLAGPGPPVPPSAGSSGRWARPPRPPAPPPSRATSVAAPATVLDPSRSGGRAVADDRGRAESQTVDRIGGSAHGDSAADLGTSNDGTELTRPAEGANLLPFTNPGTRQVTRNDVTHARPQAELEAVPEEGGSRQEGVLARGESSANPTVATQVAGSGGRTAAAQEAGAGAEAGVATEAGEGGGRATAAPLGAPGGGGDAGGAAAPTAPSARQTPEAAAGGNGGAGGDGASGGGLGAGGGGGLTIDEMAMQVCTVEDWGSAPPGVQNLSIVPAAPEPLQGVPASGPLQSVSPDDTALAIEQAASGMSPEERRERANQAVTNGLLAGGEDALLGIGMELGGTFLAKAGPLIAVRGGTLGARALGATLGSAVPIVGGIFAAVDLYHQVSTIGERPWGSMFSDTLSFLDCVGTILQIVGDVVGIVAAVLGVAGVISAIAGVGLAVGGLAATLGWVSLAISALGMVVQGAAALIRYQRILAGLGDPEQLEGELAALERNVAAATGQAGNLMSFRASTAAERQIDMRSRVQAAELIAPAGTGTGAGGSSGPTTTRGGGGPLHPKNNPKLRPGDNPEESFRNRTYTSGRTKGDTYVTRLFGNKRWCLTNLEDGNYYDAKPKRNWVSEQVPKNLASAQQELALPEEWNPAGALAILRVKEGTDYHQGTVAPVGRNPEGEWQPYPDGVPAHISERYAGGGRQGYVEDLSRLDVVDVMPFDPNIGGWRPNYKGRIPGTPGVDEDEASAEPDVSASFPDIGSLPLAPLPETSEGDWATALREATATHPPEADLMSLEALPVPPHNPGQMAARVPILGRLAARAAMLEAAAQTGDAYAAEYDRALGESGPYAQLEAEQARTRAEFDAHHALTEQKSAAVDQGEATVAELEAEQAEASQQRSQADSGSSAVDTVVSLAGNAAVRGLASLGTGAGRAVAGVVNAVGELFGADEPVIDTAVLDGIDTLIENGPALGREYGRFKSQAGGLENLASQPRRTVDDQRTRINRVQAANATLEGRLADQDATLVRGRAELQKEQAETRAEAASLHAEAEATLAERDALQAVYEREADAMEAWGSEFETARQSNLEVIDAARAQHQNPVPSSSDLANRAVGEAELADLRAYLLESIAALTAYSAGARAGGESAHGHRYPEAYQGCAREQIEAYQARVEGRWLPLVDQMEADLAAATPDQIGTVVAAIQRMSERIRAAADQLYNQTAANLDQIWFRWEDLEQTGGRNAEVEAR